MPAWHPRATPDHDWPAALAANPRDAGLWLILADWLEDDAGRATWEREPCPVCVGTDGQRYWPCPACETGTIDRTALPPHQQPPYQMRLTGELVRFEDERWHGVERCQHCGGTGGFDGKPEMGLAYRCAHCGQTGQRPTFALLLDREELYIRPRPGGSAGNQLVKVPGHLSQLAAVMRQAGDPRAEAVGALRIVRHHDDRTGTPWEVHPYRHRPIASRGEAGRNVFPTFPDAARELIRRVMALLTVADPASPLGWRFK